MRLSNRLTKHEALAQTVSFIEDASKVEVSMSINSKENMIEIYTRKDNEYEKTIKFVFDAGALKTIKIFDYKELSAIAWVDRSRAE